MNLNFLKIIHASSEERRDLFLSTATRIGTTVQNIEKDFWVCWILDKLFNDRSSDEPRLLFKGGTSLSKAYGLISRFSEDIDITVFREDLGQSIDIHQLGILSGKKQRQQLENIKQSCQTYLRDHLLKRLNTQMSLFDLEPALLDPSDPDQQTILIRYPSAIHSENSYIIPSIKIEAGAKSALDPHQTISLSPYIAEEMPEDNFMVSNIITINPERTFWDKVLILHGIRRWHDHRGKLRHEGNRISRHYYDIYRLVHSEVSQEAIRNKDLALDCANHARLFFNTKDFDLSQAKAGYFTLTPNLEMIEALKKDYLAMSTMIFGHIPDFEEIIETIKKLEAELNS